MARQVPVSKPPFDPELVDGVRGRNEELALGIDDLADSVSRLQDAAEQTGVSTAAARTSTDEVAQASSTVSAAAEELEASMREVAATSNASLEVAVGAERSMALVVERVDRLNESSQHISSVVSTVSQISRQTRMLALNATVEAARAGEAGRGFAVVAAEVKALAGQTGAATVEITERLQSLAADTTAVSEAVAEISSVLARVEELQQTIAAAVEEQTAAIGELNRSASATATAAESLHESVAASAGAAARASEAVVHARTWVDQVQDILLAQRRDLATLGADVPAHPLRAAVAAHGAWKARLRGAIEAGRVPAGTDPATASRDDVCPFGRWIVDGSAARLDARRTGEVRALHTEFHQHAGAILGSVAAGRLAEARERLADEDGYLGVSRRLTAALVAWSTEVEKAGAGRVSAA